LPPYEVDPIHEDMRLDVPIWEYVELDLMMTDEEHRKRNDCCATQLVEPLAKIENESNHHPLTS